MRHGKKFNKLGRTASHRKHMLSNMAASLITHKRINTTVPKAKALRKYVEPLITRSKTDNTHSRRVVFRYLQDKDAVNELFRDVAPKVSERPGGYVRIIRLGNRQGDDAEMCMIELVDYNELMLADKQEKKSSGSGKRRRRRGGKKKSSGQQSGKGTQQTAEAGAEEGTFTQAAESQQEESQAQASDQQEGEQGESTQASSSEEKGSESGEEEQSTAPSGESSSEDQDQEQGSDEGKDEDQDKGEDDQEKGSSSN